MADDWYLSKYFWPKDRVLRWWKQGWNWESLREQKCPHPKYKTYGDFYQPTFRFPDPRVDDNPPEISEQDYWGDRWLSEFPAGSGIHWDPYHLPLYGPENGKLSPKHPAYDGPDKWSVEDDEAFARGLKARMQVGMPPEEEGKTRNAPLAGVIVPPNTKLSFGKEPVYVNFSGALFGNQIDFANTTFGDGTGFTDTTFGRSCHFTNATFGDETAFTDTIFGSSSNFTNATFGDWADFTNVTFGRSCHFTNATFGDYADFTVSTFGDYADFVYATFGNWGTFTDADFGDEAQFTGTTFGERATFDRAKFGGWVSFAVGGGETDGRRAGKLAAVEPFTPQSPQFALTLDKQNDTRAEKAFHNISFNGAEFCGNADFTGRTFAGKTDFFGATFHKLALFSDTSFSECPKFSLVGSFFPPPGKGEKWDEEGDRTSVSMDYERAYRRLKILMHEQGALNEEQFFHALELQSRMQRLDRENVSKTEKVFAWLYGLVSDYGQSVTKPLFWIGMTFAITVALLWLLSGFAGFGWSLVGLGHALTYALYNCIPILNMRDVMALHPDYRMWLATISSANIPLVSRWGFFVESRFVFFVIAFLQTAIDLVLLFLLGLAMRRKFRIG